MEEDYKGHLVPVVIDNGTGLTKIGFAGEERPRQVFPSYVGRPKHLKIMAGGIDSNQVLVGSKAEEKRGLLRLRYVLKHGVVEDWDGMERIWRASFEDLTVDPKEHPVLLTEAPLNPRPNREKAAEIMFETLNVPALFVAMQAMLSIYGSGRTTGVLLDCGDGVSHCVPVYEGFAVPHAIRRIDIAGREVTAHMQRLLRRAGYPFHTSAELEVVKGIKEKVCYVATDPKQEEQQSLRGKAPALICQHTLPDGHTIHIGPERFRAPEVLFDPSLAGSEFPGLPQCVHEAISLVDLDLRRDLCREIVLSGGSTQFRGFVKRMLAELDRLLPTGVPVRIAASDDRALLPWIGGSILASLDTFRRIWVSHQEYDEQGPRIVSAKSF
eukprot:gnl/Trimastix_PCT/2037.p1 GENE.gnl/Trimastix_PCT/2037~~gnl/Trimastix_PCT/2037.p1  ORF type:complete len:382 (+),score=81.29 gnl/Trimastix_PCT/2037:64-1209(+)